MSESSAKFQRRRKHKIVLVALLLVVVLALAGYWPLALLLAVFFYIGSELFFADHIFYSPRCDYRYRLQGQSLGHRWQAGQLELTETTNAGDTLLLEALLSASPTGYLLDPCIELRDGSRVLCQYFERGVGGRRYINLSAFAQLLVAGGGVQLVLRHCRLDQASSTLWSWRNENLSEQSTLVIAPHPDDAEIAAFGLYSRTGDCSIVTLTAGETEVKQFLPWMDSEGDERQASRFKGEVRCHDSVAAAIWGGLPQERCVSLGYACLQLRRMQQSPDDSEPSPWSGLEDTRPFRRFNRLGLPSDGNGRPSWNNLVADLEALIARYQPGIIIAPHPQLDTHPDHICATRAVWQALGKSGQPEPKWLLYANHVDASQDYPFGPAHSEVGLPPNLRGDILVGGLYRVGLDANTRRRKALALDLMHDLKRPIKAKKWLRKRLQHFLPGRSINPYGEDDFFRKAVRPSEMFFVADSRQMSAMLKNLQP